MDDARIRLIGRWDCGAIQRDVPAVVPLPPCRCGAAHTITQVWLHRFEMRAIAMRVDDKDDGKELVVTYERRPSRGEPFRPWGDKVELRFAGEESV